MPERTMGDFVNAVQPFVEEYQKAITKASNKIIKDIKDNIGDLTEEEAKIFLALMGICKENAAKEIGD